MASSQRLLASADGSDVWLASHEKTRVPRVFKDSPPAVTGWLRSNARATLSRVLMELLGPNPGIIKLYEWNFEESPYFLECEYGGHNWLEWAQAEDRLAKSTRQERIGLMLQAIQAVAAAHGVGVMHKDLKPANLLIEPAEAGGWQVRLADFGCGRMLDPQQLEAMSMTRLGMTLPAIGDSNSGTLLYMPPEVLAGHLPMPSADVYALGILLYQMLAGDLRKPLATGWEHDIDDPLLRADIAAATHGDPARRMQTALELAERLEHLEQRRQQAATELRAVELAARQRRELDLTRARRPWALGLAISVVIGFVIGSIYLHRALMAEHAAQSASLTAGRGEAARRGDQRLPGERPAVRCRSGACRQEGHDGHRGGAQVHRRHRQAPGRSTPGCGCCSHDGCARLRPHWRLCRCGGSICESRGPVSQHGQTYDPLAGEAIAADILHVLSLVDDGQVKPATERLGQIESTLSGAPYNSAEVRKLLYYVRGKLAIQAGDYPAARKLDEQALAAAEQSQGATELPQESLELLASLRKDYAFNLEQTGDAPKAVAVMRERLAADQSALGPAHTQVLIDKLELAEAMDTESPADPAGEALIEEVLPGLDQALGVGQHLQGTGTG